MVSKLLSKRVVFIIVATSIILLLSGFFLLIRPMQIENNCKKYAEKITGGKANMLFPYSKEDWNRFKGTPEYTGFTTYAHKEQIECQKRQKQFFLF